MNELLLVAIVVAVLVQCTPPVPTPIEPEPLPPAKLDCKTACWNERILGCEEAAPTEGGASCEMVCWNAAASPAPLPVACISRAKSCEEVRNCVGP